MNANIIPFRERVSCTVTEACSGTGLSRSKLYEEIRAGRVQTAKIGKRTLIVVSSLVLLVEQPSAGVRMEA
jgi:excisionase family DNA binding protein